MYENIADTILIRPLRIADISFILYSSIDCLCKYLDTIYLGYTEEDLRSHLELLFLYVLKSYDKYNTFILCDQNHDENIIAYIVADREANHIVMQYTKYIFRQGKVAKLHFQKNYLLPLAVDIMKPITVNWGTRQMQNLIKVGKVRVVNLLLEDFIRSNG